MPAQAGIQATTSHTEDVADPVEAKGEAYFPVPECLFFHSQHQQRRAAVHPSGQQRCFFLHGTDSRTKTMTAAQ